jgi:Peptidase A4 family
MHTENILARATLALLIICAVAYFFVTQSARARPEHVTAANGSPSAIPATRASSALNWAGYVASGGSYTSVSGSWIVPHVAGASINSADATWVGIGGQQSQDLIQAGTEAVPDADGTISYHAWFETLPRVSQVVPLLILPGDDVSVSITQEGRDAWIVSFGNAMTGQGYQTTVHYQSSLSSAEWIEEVPVEVGGLVWLDEFGTVEFSRAYATRNGVAVTIAESGAGPLTMENALGQAIASPSGLNVEGSGFSVLRTNASTKFSLGNYGSLNPLLIASTQVLDQESQNQLAKIAAQQREIDGLKTEIKSLQRK